MICIFGAIFAGLLGLAFGSFLNVCLSRWPEGESVVKPRSHCRNCDHTLAWWENVPVVSWLFLRGRCGNCHYSMGWRYPLVELAVGLLWSFQSWKFIGSAFFSGAETLDLFSALANLIGLMIFYWILIALSVLDAENFWLPNSITFSGIGLGFIFTVLNAALEAFGWSRKSVVVLAAEKELLAILVCSLLILLIRWLYRLIRHREGIGLGDAKLMALLAAWLGLPGALLSFAIGAILGSLAALALLAVLAARRGSESWAATKLPLGTFLCIGGIISALWGRPLIAAYLRWAGF
jgi:leader peptidase (prepilin peptidase)/N-methyltransferase